MDADLNLVMYPPFQISPFSLPEGINPGDPQDDQPTPFFRIPGSPSYQIFDPDGTLIATNDNPSGTSEWESFVIAQSGILGANNFDVQVSSPNPPGLYTWDISNVDNLNTLFLYTLYNFYPAGEKTECDLQLTKTCQVAPPSSANLLCEEAIAATTLRYTGPDISGATVTFSGKDNGSVTYTNVDLVSGVTELTGDNGWTIDGSPKLGSKTTITINDVEEIIHTSCSAVYEANLPAPLDKDTPNPPNSAKGDPSPNWFVVNFIDEDGNTVSVPEPTGPAQVCTVPGFAGPVCDKDDGDFEEVQTLVVRYSGGGCNASSNEQGDKASCEGAIDGSANVTLTSDEGYDISPATVGPAKPSPSPMTATN